MNKKNYAGIDLSLLRYACEIIGDTNNGLTGSKIIKYSNDFAVQYDVKIPFPISIPMPTINKRTILFLNLQSFNKQQQIEILAFLCNLEYKDQAPIQKLKKTLSLKFGDAFGDNITTSELIIETENELSQYSNVLKVYEEGLLKYREGKYLRNILDDMRLSIELLLKNLLHNDKSLENQKSELGAYLKERDISVEIRNTFIIIIDYYAKYQDNNIKHNYSVNELEIEYIIEQTSVLIRFLIRIN